MGNGGGGQNSWEMEEGSELMGNGTSSLKELHLPVGLVFALYL